MSMPAMTDRELLAAVIAALDIEHLRSLVGLSVAVAPQMEAEIYKALADQKTF